MPSCRPMGVTLTTAVMAMMTMTMMMATVMAMVMASYLTMTMMMSTIKKQNKIKQAEFGPELPFHLRVIGAVAAAASVTLIQLSGRIAAGLAGLSRQPGPAARAAQGGRSG